VHINPFLFNVALLATMEVPMQDDALGGSYYMFGSYLQASSGSSASWEAQLEEHWHCVAHVDVEGDAQYSLHVSNRTGLRVAVAETEGRPVVRAYLAVATQARVTDYCGLHDGEPCLDACTRA
jgi:hypothetical protein